MNNEKGGTPVPPFPNSKNAVSAKQRLRYSGFYAGRGDCEVSPIFCQSSERNVYGPVF